MNRARTLLIRFGAVLIAAAALLAAAVGAMVLRHRGRHAGRELPGGILVGDAAAYDALVPRLLFGPLYDRIAADVAKVAGADARVLDVGCGPGRLSMRLASRHGLDVTGLDLDPGMIDRAQANARHRDDDSRRLPTFLVGDVAALPFPDASFDLVVSTLSVHHWSDPTAGLTEIGRVLRPNGRALIWDLRSRHVPFHSEMPDPVDHIGGSGLRLVSAAPWRWPWKFALTTRIELIRPSDL